jgi:RsiW-degrading membrane proteinase PrsW (M82 family)
MIKPLILAAAIVPALAMLGYGIAKARGTWKCEAIWSAYVLGALSAVAAAVGEVGLGYFIPLGHVGSTAAAAACAIAVAVTEESVKFLVLINLAEKHVDVRRLQSVLVVALAVSLGFATLENLGYVIAKDNWKIIAAMRAITSVPGHGLDGLAMGALLIAARLSGDTGIWRRRNALVIPILLHAAYDFPLLARHGGPILFGVTWLVTLALSSVLVIALCNLIIPLAVEFDRASGRDGESVETSDRLIAGGVISLVGGPLLALSVAFASGLDSIAAAIGLGVIPFVLGIDAIRTGIWRRKPLLAMTENGLLTAGKS